MRIAAFLKAFEPKHPISRVSTTIEFTVIAFHFDPAPIWLIDGAAFENPSGSPLGGLP